MTNKARFKDFGSSPVATESLSFKIYGEVFECKPAVQGVVILNAAKMANTSDENMNTVLDTIDYFFSETLLPESLKRFNEMLKDPEKVVSVETLSEIIAWLMGEYSNRPTQES